MPLEIKKRLGKAIAVSVSDVWILKEEDRMKTPGF